MTPSEYNKVMEIIESNFEVLWVSGTTQRRAMTPKGLEKTRSELKRLVKWEANTKK